MSALDLILALSSDETKEVMKKISEFIKKEQIEEKYGIEVLANSLSALSSVANDMVKERKL